MLARDAVEDQARVRKRTRPVDKALGRNCVLSVAAELALLHPIQNVLGWHVREKPGERTFEVRFF